MGADGYKEPWEMTSDELEAEVRQTYAKVQDRADRAHVERRLFTAGEVHANQANVNWLTKIRAAIETRERSAAERPDPEAGQGLEQRNAERADQVGAAIERARSGKPEGHSPLLVSATHLRSHAQAIHDGTVYGAGEEILTRAVMTVAGDMGSAGSWGSPAVPGPVTLRAFANIPNTPLTGGTAQMPTLTLPAGAAGVAETVAHGEYDAVDVEDLAALRYGRWSEVTALVDAFDQLTAINQAHAVGIARDLNLADGTVIQTAAGTPAAFDTDLLDENVRAAILKVAAATLVTPEDVVVFGQSAALAKVTGYAPASGGDRGSVSTRVFGARVYVHEQATVGIVYAFNSAAFRVFSSVLRSASVIDPTTGGHKFGQWLHSTPAGVGVVGGAAAVDVLTP